MLTGVRRVAQVDEGFAADQSAGVLRMDGCEGRRAGLLCQDDVKWRFLSRHRRRQIIFALSGHQIRSDNLVLSCLLQLGSRRDEIVELQQSLYYICAHDSHRSLFAFEQVFELSNVSSCFRNMNQKKQATTQYASDP